MLMDMLMPVRSNLLLVRRAHYDGRISYFVTVAESFGLGETINKGARLARKWNMIVFDPERGKARDIQV